ncbi:hypothetical protein BGZ46_008039 [Entomortierella lignicola]|nr:hypothetical protein BGZ46_008039 [Entomortierella lignicola]
MQEIMECDAKDELGVLEQYCSKHNVDQSIFKPAIDIFLMKTETIEADSANSDVADTTMRIIVNKVSTFLKKNVGVETIATTHIEDVIPTVVFEDSEVVQGIASQTETALMSNKTRVEKWQVLHLFLTSGNKMVAKEVTPPIFNDFQGIMSYKGKKRNNTTEEPTRKRNRKNKKQKGQQKRKILRNKASKWVRQQHALQSQAQDLTQQDGSRQSSGVIEPTGGGRKRNLGNVVGDKLNGMFKMSTLNLGTIEACYCQAEKITGQKQ